jgi:hypothetical protein
MVQTNRRSEAIERRIGVEELAHWLSVMTHPCLGAPKLRRFVHYTMSESSKRVLQSRFLFQVGSSRNEGEARKSLQETILTKQRADSLAYAFTH